MTKQDIKGYLPDNCINLDHFPHIKGYDFNEKFNFKRFLKSFSTTGMQASNLGKAIEIIKTMQREKAAIFLSYTSNMVSSGNREIIRYLVQHKLVHCLITTAGGIEEDVIKTLKPFVLGSYKADPREMFDKGVNRIGNIFVTNDRYLHFEKFMNPFIEKIYKEQKKKNKIFATNEILKKLGAYVDSKESILYWADKNDIPVFCPALTDGAFGDLLFWQKQRTKDFCVDITQDLQEIVKLSLNSEKTGVICLGGGTTKHYTLNAQIFREGADYAVYINTGNEYEGSDSGAAIDEAMTWAKVKTDALNVKVHGDATIIFPLIIAGVLETR